MDFEALVAEVTRRVMARIAHISTENACCQETGAAPAEAACPAAKVLKEVCLDKRVVTEKDVKEVCKNSATCLVLGRRTIITDLARDYAKDRGLQIIRKE